MFIASAPDISVSKKVQFSSNGLKNYTYYREFKSIENNIWPTKYWVP